MRALALLRISAFRADRSTARAMAGLAAHQGRRAEADRRLDNQILKFSRISGARINWVERIVEPTYPLTLAA
jgi:hypothetical protein